MNIQIEELKRKWNELHVQNIKDLNRIILMIAMEPALWDVRKMVIGENVKKS